VDLVGDIDESNPECYRLSEIRSWQGLEDVHWKGRRRDVFEQISSAHVLVHPSHYGEGLPKVILEAGLCARAVVTCDTVGCREVVRHRDNGLLVAPNNPEALADAIEQLGRDEAWRHGLATRHRERVLTEFGDDVILPQYRQLIERMADSVRA
jgi:glycosyltransferase involved in cell wall biosynthesis